MSPEYANRRSGQGFNAGNLDLSAGNGVGLRQMVTGHVTPSVRATGGANNNACGPCHGGNAAGFPTAVI